MKKKSDVNTRRREKFFFNEKRSEGKVLKCCVTVLVLSNMKKVKLETSLIFLCF